MLHLASCPRNKCERRFKQWQLASLHHRIALYDETSLESRSFEIRWSEIKGATWEGSLQILNMYINEPY